MDTKSEIPQSPRSSGSTSPLTIPERRSFIVNNLTPEVRLIKRILNKITDITYEGYKEQILKINVLVEEDTSKDEEIMKPIVDNFISIICEDTENNKNIPLYTRFFCEIVKKWSERQRAILLNSTISVINNLLLVKYLNRENYDDDNYERDRRKCFCLVKFLHYLYVNENNILPSKIIMIIMEKFYSIKEQHLDIFIRLLTQNMEKLNSEKIFQVKLKEKYKTFLESHKDDAFSSRQFNYMINDCIKLF